MFTVEQLRALKGAPLSIMVALSLVGAAVSNEWLVANTGYSDKPVASALMYLREHGYVVLTTGGWKLAGPERQMPLGASPDPSEPFDPVPLQAGVPLETSDEPGALRQGVGNSDSESGVVVLKNLVNESIKNNNNNGASRRNSDSLTENRANGAHIAAVLERLVRKGQPGPAGDDRLPPELLLCAERLVAVLHLSHERAELVVSGSPWDAAKILAEIDAWLIYRRSPDGANLKAGLFPFLVAARIEKGDECPPVAPSAGGTRSFDGYLQPDEPTEQEQGE